MMAGIYAYLMLLYFWGSNRKGSYFRARQQSLGQFLLGRRDKPSAVDATAKDGKYDHNSERQTSTYSQLSAILK